MEDRKSPSLSRRVISLTGICLLASIAGYMMSWGAIVVYLTSYLHIYNSQASLALLSSAFSYSTPAFSIGSVLGTWLYHWTGSRIAFGLGLILGTGMLALCSLIQDLYWSVAALSVTIGAGPGMLFFPLLFCSWTVFPNGKGLATGLTSFSFCAGGMLYGLAFTFLVNPDNLSPSVRSTAGTEVEYLFPPSVALQVPAILRGSAAVGLAIGVLAVFMIFDQTSRLERKSIVYSMVSKQSSKQNQDQTGCPTIKIALKTSAFWVLFGLCGLSITYPNFMIVQYKNYGERYIKNDQYLSALGAFGLVVNAFARLICTWLTDFMSYKLMAMSICLGLAAVAFTITLIASNTALYVIWVLISFFGQGSVITPMAVICGNIYGADMGGKVFSLIAIGSALANIALGIGTVPMIQILGFEWSFWICGGTAVTAAVLAAGLKVSYDWDTEGQSPFL